MNEEVQKIIKASFCAKQKWIKDDNAHNCFKCDKKFHVIYRRKHHCRYCGQIFCATCSDFYLPGKDLGEAQKAIRMCEACIQKCWKYIAKHDDTYLEFRKSGEHDVSKNNQLPENIEQIQLQSKPSIFSQEDKRKQIQAIIAEYENNQAKGIQILEQEVNKKFGVLLQVILKNARIPLMYFQQILNIANEVVTRVPPNFIITGNMNICQNVRIKCFHNEQFRLNLQPIVLIKKTFTNKKIKDDYDNVTCILVYGNIESVDLVGGDKQVSFENMINNRLKQMNKIISYCQRVKINLVFLEGIIQKQFEDMLSNSSITVIPKVKIQYLSRLKASLKIEKIVSGIGQVYSYPQKQITGSIKKITSANYLSTKQNHTTKKFFKISTMKDDLGLTLIIQHSNLSILQNLKKQFKFILQTLTHMKLKVHRVRLDQNILQSMPQALKKSCYLNNSQMLYSFYSQFHSDILSILKQKYVTYKFINYVQSYFANYPEVNKQNFDEYVKSRTHSFKNKCENFTQICGDICDQHRMFYSEDDLPLGSFLLKKFSSFDQKCPECCRPNYLHINCYYSTDQYVKIWTESMILDQTENQNAYSSFASQDDPKNNQMEMIFTYLQKNTQKQKLKCFIECYDCQQPLSSKVNVHKLDLEFSTLSFIHHMFKGSSETTIRQNNSKKNQKTKNSACSHIKKVRVYSLGQKFVKIYAGKYTINRLCVLTETGRSNFLKKKQTKSITQTCLLQSNRIERIIQFLYQQIKVIAQQGKNSQIEMMMKNPRSSFIKARQSIGYEGNVRLSQVQCIDMILPELIDIIKQLNNAASNMLSIKRVTTFIDGLKLSYIFLNILKKIYLIISELKKAIKKRELDKKYQMKDFQNDFLTQDIDINNMLEGSDNSIDNSSERSSQISKSDLYSNIQTLDTSNSQFTDYGWLQPNKEEVTLSRADRKTQSNILQKKSNIATEDEVYKIFKVISSALKIDHGYFQFIPCYGNKPQTLIASALNSQHHKQCITSNQFKNQLTIKITNYVDFQLPNIDNQKIKRIIMIMEIHERMFDISEKIKKDISSISYQINMLFPNEFEILRRKKNIPLELFISSIAGADQWIASGGKSGSPFMRAFNDLIVIKKIPKTEFLTFKKFLPKYFNHLHEGSILNPIYGAFTITRNLTTDYYVVMENLFFGMKEWYIYDFKGSVTRRFSKPPVIPLDVNFLIDRSSQPIFSKQYVLKNLNSTLNYLAQNNVIDYSLIMVVQIQNNQDYYLDGNRFQIGIVDYMRQFGAGEWVENMWKGPEATVVEPVTYKARMLKNLKKYFTQIPL